MTLEYMMQEEYRKGEAEATVRLNKLGILLMDAERLADLRNSMEDPAYQQQLFEELGL
ncbi:MAG: hypothetical protein IJ443_01730 [Firmicutes bacterium]|nr:hypothetical protein [Bacillota bacterium]